MLILLLIPTGFIYSKISMNSIPNIFLIYKINNNLYQMVKLSKTVFHFPISDKVIDFTIMFIY